MNVSFWLRRFSAAFVVAFIVIASAQWLKGHTTTYSTTQGIVWGLISAAIFATASAMRARRKCAVCPDQTEQPSK